MKGGMILRYVPKIPKLNFNFTKDKVKTTREKSFSPKQAKSYIHTNVHDINLKKKNIFQKVPNLKSSIEKCNTTNKNNNLTFFNAKSPRLSSRTNLNVIGGKMHLHVNTTDIQNSVKQTSNNKVEVIKNLCDQIEDLKKKLQEVTLENECLKEKNRNFEECCFQLGNFSNESQSIYTNTTELNRKKILSLALEENNMNLSYEQNNIPAGNLISMKACATDRACRKANLPEIHKVIREFPVLKSCSKSIERLSKRNVSPKQESTTQDSSLNVVSMRTQLTRIQKRTKGIFEKLLEVIHTLKKK